MKKKSLLRTKQHLQPNKFKKLFVIIAAAVFLIILFVGLRFNRFYQTISTKNNLWKQQPVANKEVFSFLLMGYGGVGHQGGYLTDTMIIGRLDIKNKKVNAVFLPRDIWVKVPTQSGDDFYTKINAVYQMGLFGKNYRDLPKKYKSDQGAAELAKQVAGNVVGFKIDYYAAVDFTGFTKAIDLLGGVDVNVDKAFTDDQYPIAGEEDNLCDYAEDELQQLLKQATDSPNLVFPCRYETIHFDAGLINMDGKTTLKFVRSRHSKEDGGDFSRARRQKAFLDALKNKVISINIITKIFPLLEQLEGHIKADIPAQLGQKLLKEVNNVSQYSIFELMLTTDNYLTEDISEDGQYLFVPKTGINKLKKIY